MTPEPTNAASVPLTLRPEVAAFAQAMERELRENDFKGTWKKMDDGALLKRLQEEFDELAIAPNKTLLSEAADVANFAMMVADVRGQLKAQPSGAATGRDDRVALAQAAIRRWVYYGAPVPQEEPGTDDIERAILATAKDFVERHSGLPQPPAPEPPAATCLADDDIEALAGLLSGVKVHYGLRGETFIIGVDAAKEIAEVVLANWPPREPAPTPAQGEPPASAFDLVPNEHDLVVMGHACGCTSWYRKKNDDGTHVDSRLCRGNVWKKAYAAGLAASAQKIADLERKLKAAYTIGRDQIERINTLELALADGRKEQRG